ncbi:methionine--tRNA ligase [Sandarakinorhabdus cyanobacteriorum]|uniref:Methionine--tRNA ligase n=1 Tax=Sandarakinorhabdus cyanobacteriorum TaxID=1981098 RepID=A0A255YHS7_9SPHN|nr:methionine--tRNA ligase [Sandarakinorhabdus cyanobacteriorum]OYQ28234.1 methionine--tRNA ligase [Sandarakinorhabdus cyanobacteriorum]
MSKPRFYVTTAIAYPNGRPHMGHAYEAIATDVIARFKRLDGHDVRFLTGTDEHGLKIDQAARAAGMNPQAYVDQMVAPFRALDEQLGISFDRFIRTTDADHKALVQALWQRMAANGDLYLGRYEGWYSVRDEAYYDEAELVEAQDAAGATIKLSPQGTPVEWTVEESWFFKLSAYQERLLTLYDSNPAFIQPQSRFNEMRAFVAGGLSDLSVSRTSFSWGIPVPGDERHVMYVWLDALANYLTGAGGLDGEWWPADLHIVGKDVVRFHTVYWPAFLMSAGIALPKTVFGHGFLLNRGEKMSKTLGNVVDPADMATRFGVDRLRWYLCREVPFGEDGSYSDEAIVERTNADLANGIGNLAQRSLSMVAKNLGGLMPVRGQPGDSELRLKEAFHAGTEAYFAAMNALALHKALDAIMGMVTAANGYFAENAPWALAKTDTVRMAEVLAATLDATRRIVLLAQPFMPASTAALLDQLGVATDARDFSGFNTPVEAGTQLPAPAGVFPRVTLDG